MSRLEPTGLLDTVSLASPQQLVFRVVALAAGWGFLALVPLSGGVFHPVLSAAGASLAVLVALMPQSNAALGLVVYLGALWMLASGGLDVWTLVAALDLFAIHLACTLTAYGPSGMVLGPGLLVRWRGRIAWCAGAATLVWLVARAVAFFDFPASGLAVALALAVLLGWVGYLTLRLVHAGED